MITITHKPTAEGLEIFLEGRLDTAAAQTCADELEQLCAIGAKPLLIDCTKLEYIASSGLRILLLLRKKMQAQGGTIRLTNVNDEVLQVLKMTGFTALFGL